MSPEYRCSSAEGRSRAPSPGGQIVAVPAKPRGSKRKATVYSAADEELDADDDVVASCPPKKAKGGTKRLNMTFDKDVYSDNSGCKRLLLKGLYDANVFEANTEAERLKRAEPVAVELEQSMRMTLR